MNRKVALRGFSFVEILTKRRIMDLSKLKPYDDKIIVTAPKHAEEKNMEGHKTMWEKEKKLVSSTFSFSHNIIKHVSF